ncbi:hypothetical protein ACG7TL_001687 [Trametes sanguinea]
MLHFPPAPITVHLPVPPNNFEVPMLLHHDPFVKSEHFHTSLQRQLLNTVIRGEKDALHKLLNAGTSHTPDDHDVIDAVYAEISRNADCLNALAKIKQASEHADEKASLRWPHQVYVEDTSDEHSTESEDSDDQDGQGGKKTKTTVARNAKREEAKLYRPLAMLCKEIEAAFASHGSARRYFRRATLCNEAPHAFEEEYPMLEREPDFAFVEVPAPPDGRLVAPLPPMEKLRWRACPAFMALKSRTADIPTKTDSSNGTSTLAQAAEYAAMILMARPHQLVVFGVLLCGHKFCVAYFDRNGIVVSPGYSVVTSSGLKKFIRVILRLTWLASAEDIGHDPTVSLAAGHTYYQHSYPSFEVGFSSGSDSRRYRAIGSPLWSSPDLLGRGSNVCLAFDRIQNTVVIPKSAWRTVHRQPESVIYEKIRATFDSRGEAPPQGIADFASGGDVEVFGKKLSISRLRRPVPLQDDGDSKLCLEGVPDKILHRVVLNDIGKPLWKYTDLKQFAIALQMIIHAHFSLATAGIVHGDISAGNLFIRMRATYVEGQGIVREELESPEGFLADFELASCPEPDMQESDSPTLGSTMLQRDSVPTPEKISCAPIIGTLIFMATRLLHSIAVAASDHELSSQSRSHPTSGQLPPRTVTHDVESFGWVIIYTFYRRALQDEDLTNSCTAEDREFRALLNMEFAQLFCTASVQALYQRRLLALADTDSGGIAQLIHYAEEYAKSLPLSDFLHDVWRVLVHCPQKEPSLRTENARGRRQRPDRTNDQRRKRGMAERPTQGVVDPAIEERWQNIDHAEWLGPLRALLDYLNGDQQNQ